MHDAYAHRLTPAFQFYLSMLRLPEVEPGSGVGRIADQRLAGTCFRHQTRRDVHVITQSSPFRDGTFHSTHASEVGDAGVNANTDGKAGAASIAVAGGT